MKNLQDTIQEALTGAKPPYFRLFGAPVFQSNVVNRDTVETTIDD